MPDILIVLIIILVIAVVLRGPKTLPKIGEALGRGVKEARTEATKGLGDGDDADQPPSDTTGPH